MEIQQAPTLYSLHHHHHHHGGFPQPIDCSPPEILDLCIRKRCRTPSPEGARQKPLYADPPTSMVCFSSPGSHTDSETSESSFTTDPYSAYPNSLDGAVIQKAKIPRPFKAYPKDPLTLAMGVATAETMLGKNSADAYVEFRHKMLSQVQTQNQGTNIKMRRTTATPSNPQNSDPTYWEKRRKNNEAAKRSRDARRAKEDEIAIRCAFLEQENLKLKYEVAALRNENERLRTVAYH